VVAAYDPSTGKLTWGDKAVALADGRSSAGADTPPSLGEESWKWLFLQPLTSGPQ
jgi:phospholipid/cholesterol/gamma-HCH transport system substrate-binding protein